MSGLSEEDKSKHPFFLKKRFEELTKTEGFKKIKEAHDLALENLLYEELKGNFEARKTEPSVRRVVEGTFVVSRIICERILNRDVPILAEKMLERFDLMKKK